MSSWLWLARLASTEPVPEVAHGDGAPLIARASLSWPGGLRETLVAWAAGPRPSQGARRADAALIDPKGPATRAVVQWLEQGRDPLFDDLAVQHVLRMVAAWPRGPMSTLTRDTVHYCGAVQVVEATGERGLPRADTWPLHSLGPASVCDVGPGLLATRTRAVHGTQRYRGAPWPAPDRSGCEA